MSQIYSSGQELRSIENREYKRYDTDRAEKIIITLEKCDIPYFARYNSTSLSLTYDSTYENAVEEIIGKVNSGDYRELVREIGKNKSNRNKILLAEISELLNTSISLLRSRPDEIQDLLCKRYTDLWHCDTNTLRRELSDILRLKYEAEKEDRYARSR